MDTPSIQPCLRCGARPGGTALAGALCQACLLEGVLAGTAWTGPEEDGLDFPPGPERCGAYELLEEIGRGAAGVVFRARQTGLTRSVAVKLLSQSAGPEEWRRFRTEAEAVTGLDHPHIIPVHASGETDGRPWLVMKLAEQGSLADRLRQFPGGLPPEEAARLVQQIASAVQFAHERGVLHRDLKPGNILLDAGGLPMVSDFGLARLLHGQGTGTLTGFAVGTPAYMPPEQASGDTVTTVSDVYSLGAILYHLLTGRPPFAGTMALSVMRDVMALEPAPPHQVRSGLDRDLGVICQKAMDKSPLRRYASAAALAEDLARWQRGDTVLARPASLRRRCWKWARRHPAKAAALTLSVLGAVAFVTLLSIAQVMLTRERNEVKRQEGEALAQARRAEANGEALRQQAYAADTALARRAFDEGNSGSARNLLARWQPGPDIPDVRGFEWYHLNEACQGDDLAVLRPHTAPVLSLAFSPDGQLLATGGRDGKLVISRASDGSLLRTLPGTAPMNSLAELAWLAKLPLHSPETTSLLATGSLTPAEILMRSRPSSISEVNALAWSPDGHWLATGSTGAFVRLWNPADWSIQGFIPLKGVVQVGFSPDSRRIITGSTGLGGSTSQGEVRVYNLSTLERVLTVPDAGAFFAVAPQDPFLAVSEPSGKIQLINLSTLARTTSWESSSPSPNAMAFSRDGTRLAVAYEHGLFTADALTGNDRHQLSDSPAGFECVAAAPHATAFAAGGADQTISLFEDAAAARSATGLRGHDDAVRTIAFSPDGQQLGSGGNDHTIRLWNPAAPPRRFLQSIPGTDSIAAVSPDGRCLLGVTPEGGVFCRQEGSGATVPLPGGVVRKPLGFDPQSGDFATLQPAPGLVEWWHPDGSSAAPPLSLAPPGAGSPAPITTFAVCPAKGWILTGGGRLPLLVRDWHSGTERYRFTHSGPVSRLILPPDGSFLGVLAWPRTLRRVDPLTGKWLDPWQLGTGTVGPITFSPDSRLMASGGDDNLITVRDSRTGAILATLKSHLSELTALAFSRHGQTLASAARDRTVRLWHVPTWRELGTFRRGPLATFLAFSPKGLLVEEYQDGWLLLPGQN